VLWSVEVEPPEGVAEDFVLHALSFAGVAFDLDAGTRRSEHIEAVGGAYLVNAEEVGTVADDDDAMQAVGSGDDGKAMDRLVGAGAFGFGDDVRLGNPGAFKVLLAHGSFGELVAAIAAESDD